MLAANSQVELDQSSESQPIESVSSSCTLSEVPRGRALLSKEQVFRNQRVEALEDLETLTLTD